MREFFNRIIGSHESDKRVSKSFENLSVIWYICICCNSRCTDLKPMFDIFYLLHQGDTPCIWISKVARLTESMESAQQPFLAPTGAQEMQMSIRFIVRLLKSVLELTIFIFFMITSWWIQHDVSWLHDDIRMASEWLQDGFISSLFELDINASQPCWT